VADTAEAGLRQRVFDGACRVLRVQLVRTRQLGDMAERCIAGHQVHQRHARFEGAGLVGRALAPGFQPLQRFGQRMVARVDAGQAQVEVELELGPQARARAQVLCASERTASQSPTA
jgi:hypothetical protein